MTADLSIIIVSWNVRELLRACLLSIQRSPGISIAAGPPSESADTAPPFHAGPTWSAEVIVVDNASIDDSPAMVASEFPWVHLLTNTANRGFTAANNQGLVDCHGRYVLFLNPDTELVGSALPDMLRYVEEHPAVGALGPRLVYADGTLQSSCRRFPGFLAALFESTPLAWHWPNNPWARRYHMDDRRSDEIQDVDWVVGAALLVRQEALAAIGGFDEGYFMYSEELDWCRRAAAAGWRTVYLPAAQVIHYEGKSSDQAVAARHIRFQTSKVRYFRKFHGPLAAEGLRMFLLAAFACEWLLEAAKWLAGSRRPLRRNRMAAYGQLMLSGLHGRM